MTVSGLNQVRVWDPANITLSPAIINIQGADPRNLAVSADGLNSDLHGSADYRAALIPVLAGRAVAAA